MAAHEQLEVITTTGDLSFHDLDYSDGITNIGRHPSNNVVLSAQGIADFHLVLDHRQEPFQVATLVDVGTVTLNGTPLQANDYRPLHPWDNIDVNGTTIILVPGDSPSAAAAPTSAATQTLPQTSGAATPAQPARPAAPGATTPSAGASAPPTGASAGQQAGRASALSAPGASAGAGATPPLPPRLPTPMPPGGGMPGGGMMAGGAAVGMGMGAGAGVAEADAPESGAPGAAPGPASPAGGATGGATAGAARRTNGAQAGIPAYTLSGNPYGDQVDEVVVVELVGEREHEVKCEEVASWQLVVINGGPLVAQFEINVQGYIDPAWVTITPQVVNLYEGDRATVTITMSAPRLPSSIAGAHPFAIIVASPNYHDHMAQRTATLHLEPYYDYAVGDLRPRVQTVSYFRRSGRLALTLHNRGNSETPFRVEGSDDENSVTFEMCASDEETVLVRQIELRLQPDEQITLPITATPRQHRFIGVGRHLHTLTVSTTPLEAPQATPRSVLAQLRNAPVVGPWVITALAILLAAAVIFLFRPRINSFAFAPGAVEDTIVQVESAAGGAAGGIAGQVGGLQGKKIFGLKIPKLPRQLGFIEQYLPDAQADGETTQLTAGMIEAGNEVTLIWNTSLAETVTLEKIVGGDRQFVASFDNPATERFYTFRADLRERATYVLTVNNWIERLPFIGDTLGRDEERVALIVDPVQPVIAVWDVTPLSLVTGEAVNITWQVNQATEYDLLVNQVPVPLQEARGSLQEAPRVTTEYRLSARSPYWDEPVLSAPRVVAVALPTPVIRVFDVNPKPIVDGQLVSVTWAVDGASEITIDPFPASAPNSEGQEQSTLEQGRTQQTFTLQAFVGEGEQRVAARATRVVNIVPPTPTNTPTPTATATPVPPTPTNTPIPTPVIALFDIEPRPIVDGEIVRLIWRVEGAANVEINPVRGVVPNPEGQDEIRIEPGKSQETFTLRAVAADGVSTVEARATRVVQVVTATPTVTPTPTPSPTLTPQLPSIQVFELVPNEVVRGDAVSTTNGEGESTEDTQQFLPKLTWTVIGEATNVEVTGPDFGPVRNLPKEGTLLVPANQSTVFQLNVYYNDQIIQSLTQELTVIEPTPTPTNTPVPPPPPTATPTNTPTPTPNIASFSVNAVDDPGAVVPVPSSDDTPTYEVVAGTLVRFAWRVENPISAVRLQDSQNDYGQRSPEDEFQVELTQSTLFRLVVTGAGDQPSIYDRSIRINVQPIQPPPPPFNVTGIDGETNDDPSIVRWDYPGDSRSRLLGFRVYRANVDNFNFNLVADRFELDNTSQEWIDPVTPSCDRAYYVVGVWEDITQTGANRIRETEVSVNSWNTKPCE